MFRGDPQKRTVGKTRVGASWVSTVFMGVDQSFCLGYRRPQLFETFVFGGPLSGGQYRHAANWEQAEAMHRDMVRRVRRANRQAKGKGNYV